MIGSNVEVEILEIGASNIKLGIRAPKEVSVLRKEIQLTRQQNQAAAQAIAFDALQRLRGAIEVVTADEFRRGGPD